MPGPTPNSGRPAQSWGCPIRVQAGSLNLGSLGGLPEEGVWNRARLEGRKDRRRIPGLVNCIGEERVCVQLAAKQGQAKGGEGQLEGGGLMWLNWEPWELYAHWSRRRPGEFDFYSWMLLSQFWSGREMALALVGFPFLCLPYSGGFFCCSSFS